MNRSISVLFFVCCITTSFVLHAQQASIKGQVKDEQGLPVDLANVILLQLPDSTEVSVKTTDTSGYYSFENISKGEYTLVSMQLGFNKSVSDKLVLEETSSVQHNFVLTSEFKSGGEVVIAGRKSIVRQEGDKLIIDVENTLSNSGLTAVDVLRKSPGISVNKDGIITLKGKNGVLVMLDDKPLYMTEEQVGNLLKSIPSDQIKSIEIITAPSAKYDAAGNAGIVNIKLKKGAYEGFHGSANASYGQGRYPKVVGGVSVSYKKKKLSLNSGYQYNYNKGLTSYYVHRTYDEASPRYSRLNSDVYFKEPRESHNVNFGVGYDLTDKTSLSYNLIAGYSENAWDGGGNTYLYNPNGSVSNGYSSLDVGKYIQTNINTSIGAQHKLDTIGTKVSFDVNYNNYTGVSNKDFSFQNYDSLNQTVGQPFLFLYRDPSYSRQFMAKTDFEAKVFKNTKIESGLKLNLIDQDNPASITITENAVRRDASNFYKYNENIYAGYTTLRKTMGKFIAQAGLRAEHTLMNGVQRLQDTSYVRKFTNLFPSANFTYNQTDKTSYSILYSRRIQRPTPWQLNPVLNIIDPFTSWGGNPNLLPEYTDNAELNWSLFSGYLITTLNYSYTAQPITWVLEIDSSTLKTINRPQNLVLRENAGISMALNMPITKWWQSNNYVYAYRNRFVGDVGYGQTDNSVLSWNANFTQTFTIAKKTNIEASGNYQSASVYGLFRTKGRGQLTFAIQRKIWANKASIKLSASDIFWTEGWVATSTLGTTETKSGEKWDSRVVMATFTYKFGKKLNIL